MYLGVCSRPSSGFGLGSGNIHKNPENDKLINTKLDNTKSLRCHNFTTIIFQFCKIILKYAIVIY